MVSDLGQVSSLLPITTAEEKQLQRDAYTKISLVAHSWKIAYFTLHPDGTIAARNKTPGEGKDVWQILLESEFPSYSRENWTRYYPLFNEHLENVRRDLQDAQAAYADILSPKLRSRIEQTRTQLTADRTAYYYLSRSNLGDDSDRIFRSMFAEVFRTLGALDVEVQHLLNDL